MNSTTRLLRAKSTRMWVQYNEKVSVLNYWYYRYFTHSYTDFILRRADLSED